MVKKRVTFALPLVTFCAPLILSSSTVPAARSKEEPPLLEDGDDFRPPKSRPHDPYSTPEKPSHLPPKKSLSFSPSLTQDMVRIKAILGGDVRRFSIDEPSFATLHDHIRASYSIPHIAIKYCDEEGDFVTLSSDAELMDAVTIAEGDGGLLRLLLHPSPISYPYAQPPPRLAPHRHSYPYTRHHSHSPPPRRHVPPGRVPPMYRPPPPMNPPPPMYPGDIEQNTDRLLDSILGAVSWLLLGCVLYNGIPLYNTLLLVGFVSLHRRLLIRPFIKRNVVAMIQARRMAPPPPHVQPPPHTPYALHPHPPHPR